MPDPKTRQQWAVKKEEPKPINQADGQWAEDKEAQVAADMAMAAAAAKKNAAEAVVGKAANERLVRDARAAAAEASAKKAVSGLSKLTKTPPGNRMPSALDKYGEDYQTIYERGGMRRVKD